MSNRSEKRSTILPLPSSPHWEPRIITFAILDRSLYSSSAQGSSIRRERNGVNGDHAEKGGTIFLVVLRVLPPRPPFRGEETACYHNRLGRIRILPDQVANKIAAGEVVERPASVVKELLENSLDAGATTVRVEVESGGRRLIRIVDDGCGMLRDDALLAFERHATSKLRDVKDLLSIATLGFRGEALPSIASVSRLLLETRAAEETTGTRIEIAGGKMLRCEEAALSRGTVMTVRDLFYNVPARRKFLRTEQTELAHIASLVTHYSLAHADKTFLLTSGPTELLHVTPVGTMKERVYQVFGSQVLDELVEIGMREKEIYLPPPNAPASEAIAE